MASFPTSIKSFTTKTDNVTDVLAEHVNSLQDEVVAIETALGVGYPNGYPKKRVSTEASNATPAINSDSYDMHTITAQAAAATFGTPTGTPTQGQQIIYRIKDNATARALSWNAIYRAMGNPLPSTTVLSKTLYLGFIYNSTDTKWDLIAVAQEA
jgi:hypothetical protein